MKSLMSLILVLASIQAMASNHGLKKSTQDYLTIRSVEYKDLTNEYRLKNQKQLIPLKSLAPAGKSLANPFGSLSGTLNQVDFIVDKIINIGQKVWTVVEKGHPDLKFENAGASALPANANTFTDLVSWKQPESKVIGISYKNLYGVEVVRFVYQIVLLAGGSVNGVGNYIGYASVEQVETTVSYLYKFDSQAVVVNIFNKGTHENPLAGMILTVRWSVETVLKKSVGSHTFFIDGLGNIDPAEKASLK